MKKRVLIIIFLVIISFFSISTGSIYNNVSNIIDKKIFQTKANKNKMKVSYLNIKDRTTGTAPFNNETESNEYGIDVSSEDNYVRTFDYIKYNLEIGVIPNTDEEGVTSSSVFKGGVIKIKAKIPNQGDKILMTWEKDAWMQNISFNSDKTQIYAEYFIPDNSNISNVNQKLTFTIKVNGYKRKISSDMNPEFEAWMDGNNEDLIIKTKDPKEIIISGKPSYDIDLQKSTYIYKGTKEAIPGEYIAYGVGVALIQPYNNIPDLRGVEYPTGKFEVDLDNTYTARIANTKDNYFNVDNSNTSLVAYSINYEENDLYYKSKNVHTRSLPKGKGGTDRGVTNSGNITATYNSSITTISFNNYELDNNYPNKNIVALVNKPSYKENLGYIMSGNVQLFIPFYDVDSDKLYDYKYNVKVNKIKYYDTNNNLYEITNGEDKNKSNNNISIEFNKKNSGSFYTASRLAKNTDSALNGLASSYSGEYINPAFTLMPVTGPYDKAERIIIWNTNYFDIVSKNKTNFVTVTCTSELGIDCPTNDSITIKYGVYKLNKDEGITSDELVNSVYFNDFDWYETPEEAKFNGKITAIYALDNDVIGNRIHRYINPKFKVTENKEYIGKVGMMIQRCKIYDEDIIYEPYKNNKYVKTTYTNQGDIVKTHSSYNLGLSVLILGEKANIESAIIDKDEEGNIKTNYNANDKVINMMINPSITNENITTNDRVTDSVIIKTTLPKELNYKDNSSNKEPKEILYNEDETTTIVWEYNNWTVNEPAPKYPNITYSIEINSSVNNNEHLNITTTIYDKYDLRDIKYRSVTNEVYISNLSGSMTSQKIDKNILDIGEDFTITNTIGNISQLPLNDIKTTEILPDGDYKIKVVELYSNQNLFYTSNKKESIDQDDESIWKEANVGDIIENATALLSKIDTINSSETINFKYTIIPGSNQLNDKYTFSMNVSSSNFTNSIKSNTTTAEVVERKISGTAFIDTNNNLKYDTEDEVLKNITVNLYDENDTLLATTTTDEFGNYTFRGLPKGNYYIVFDIPEGYSTINIDDNKALTSGKTNIINHDSERTIDNIFLGLTIKKEEPTISIGDNANTYNTTNNNTITYNYEENNDTNNLEIVDTTNKDDNKKSSIKNDKKIEDEYQFKENDIEGIGNKVQGRRPKILVIHLIPILLVIYILLLIRRRKKEQGN